LEIVIALAIGVISSLLTVLLPFGNSIVSIILANILNSIFNVDDITKELGLLSSFVIFSIIKATKEIKEPKTSGSEDFAVFGDLSEWKCLTLTPFEQVKSLVESRIFGALIGLVISYVLINLFKFDIGSLPITKLIMIYVMYKTFKDLEYKAFQTRQQLKSLIVKGLLYISIAPICFYILNIWGCYSPAVVVIYLVFILPNIIHPIIEPKIK
jgi:hypothetical protein